MFVEMERMGLISHTNLKILKKIIQKVCPMLTGKITEFETKCGKLHIINLLLLTLIYWLKQWRKKHFIYSSTF